MAGFTAPVSLLPPGRLCCHCRRPGSSQPPLHTAKVPPSLGPHRRPWVPSTTTGRRRSSAAGSGEPPAPTFPTEASAAMASERRRVVTGFVIRPSEAEGESGGMEVLLLQRSEKVRTYQGKWAAVSGSVEAGEDPAAAMVREMEEETGWRRRASAREGRPPTDVDHCMPGGRSLFFRVHPFLFSLQEGCGQRSPAIDWEHSAFQWKPPAAVAVLDVAGETVPQLHDTLARVLDPPGLVANGQGPLHRRALELFNNTEHGAAELAVQAASLVVDGADPEAVACLRPTMVALVNAARLAAAGGASNSDGSVEEQLRSALQTAVSQGAAALRGATRVATISRSSSVIGCLAEAGGREDTSLERVFVAESLPGGEGASAAEALAQRLGTAVTDRRQVVGGEVRDDRPGDGKIGTGKISVEVRTDEDVRALCSAAGRQVDVLLLGADAVLRSGGGEAVVNKVGSVALAEALLLSGPAGAGGGGGGPLQDDEWPPCMEPAFEVVPARLISSIVGLKK
eukprot:CAMPEP_0117676376 /NCGR_PEP_ID=MMETSP0804-20121206/16134_1 /TAXON_ID=1074897 /ORGANISM="Tetraselmis astigmatica, Strain CCMP880" /LENGTH=510 /DNA_ID=CAMNT_0005485499 /DNA_START=222 /DNA_END=1754 /DNA_ORIENTATION=+